MKSVCVLGATTIPVPVVSVSSQNKHLDRHHHHHYHHHNNNNIHFDWLTILTANRVGCTHSHSCVESKQVLHLFSSTGMDLSKCTCNVVLKVNEVSHFHWNLSKHCCVSRKQDTVVLKENGTAIHKPMIRAPGDRFPMHINRKTG